MIILLLLLFITTLLCLIHWKTLKDVEPLIDIPGPERSVVILGNIYNFINDDIKRIQERTIEYFQRYGDTYKLYSSWQQIIMTCSPKFVEDLLTCTNKNLSKNYLYSLLQNWLAEGLLMSTDHKWHNRRKIITPAFHFKILESFIPVFEQQGDILVNNIRKLNLKENDAFDIHDFIAHVTLDTIAETSMGIKPNSQINNDCVYTKAVQDLSHNVSMRFIRFYWRIDFLCYFFNNSLLKEYNRIVKILHNFTEQTIIERRELLKTSLEHERREGKEVEINEFGQKRRMVFLDVLLQSTIDGKPLTNLDIREEVDTFMFEGHDTTTAGLCFTLFLISRHKQVQDKIFNEIIEVIGTDKTKSINYNDLQELKYLDLVIKESLRMHPPVSVIGRTITEDSNIEGHLIPKGTEIVIHIQNMMRNPHIFEKPNEFIPERHCASDFSNLNPFAYIPFSAGPRNCIGQKYAMLEMKSVIAKILRNFELLPNGPDVKPLIGIILKSETGFHMGFKTRNYT